VLHDLRASRRLAGVGDDLSGAAYGSEGKRCGDVFCAWREEVWVRVRALL
jgi:hypothetical protein